jgi:hypothetical protein
MARLQRTLSLGAVVLFGIAYMTPISVLGTFGILAQSTAGMVPAAYLVIYLGLSWLAIGVVYLAVLTSGFRRQPPEMDFQEAT